MTALAHLIVFIPILLWLQAYLFLFFLGLVVLGPVLHSRKLKQGQDGSKSILQERPLYFGVLNRGFQFLKTWTNSKLSSKVESHLKSIAQEYFEKENEVLKQQQYTREILDYTNTLAFVCVVALSVVLVRHQVFTVDELVYFLGILFLSYQPLKSLNEIGTEQIKANMIEKTSEKQVSKSHKMELDRIDNLPIGELVFQGDLKFEEKLLIQDLNIEFQPNHVHVIQGPNGVGKSTLIHQLQNSTNQSYVSIHIESILPPHQVLRDAIQNLDVKLIEILKLGELLSLTDQEFQKRKFSAGETQKLLLALAIHTSTGWLFLDEPLSNIEYKGRSLLLGELQSYFVKNQFSIILVHHDLPQYQEGVSHWRLDQNGITNDVGTHV